MIKFLKIVKSIRFWLLIICGKVLIKMLELSGKGQGSALPGLIIEKLYPGFLNYSLNHLKFQPLVITGTNGKTTTTKLTAEIFKSQNLKVLTNPSGSNFTRGIASELIRDIKFRPIAKQFDIAVLELDEAYAKQFAAKVDIGSLLILNISRDQLDRFGEIDATQKILEDVAAKSDKLILNLLEPSTTALYAKFKSQDIIFFGAEKELAKKIITEGSLSSKFNPPKNAEAVILEDAEIGDNFNLKLKIRINKLSLVLTINLQGIYNGLNFVAALAAAQSVIDEKLNLSLVKESEKLFKPAWGRSQQFEIDGTIIQLHLVKNPNGFNHVIQESRTNGGGCALFALNDDYADGRDISWIWDVDFTKLKLKNVKTCGSRAYDMAIRLKYADLMVGMEDVDLIVSKALQKLLAQPHKNKTVFASYTAMVEIYRILSKLSEGTK